MFYSKEIDIHTDREVLFKIRVQSFGATGHSATPHCSTEVLVYDSEFTPPFASIVSFHQVFDSIEGAFHHAMTWVRHYSRQHRYNISHIDTFYGEKEKLLLAIDQH